MSSNPKRSKQTEIVSELRRRIIRHDFKPGDQLPLRTELEKRFNTSRMTIQRALDQLTDDGFFHTRGRAGTFVTANPPCFCRYGIAFHNSPHDTTWSGYHEALSRVGHEVGESTTRSISFYFGVNHEVSGDGERLLKDLQAERLAGILFSSGPWHLLHTPIVQQLNVPAMAVMSLSNRSGRLSHFSAIEINASSLLREGLRDLIGKGCRRPAFLIHSGAYDRFHMFIRTILSEFGMAYDPILVQGVSLAQSNLASHVIQLWMRLPSADRPDGLFVCDDNLVEAACEGLMRSGVRPGIDMPVAVESNFPGRVGSQMPLERVGFDIRVLMRNFIINTDRRRSNNSAPESFELPAVHERDSMPVSLTSTVQEKYTLAGVLPAS